MLIWKLFYISSYYIYANNRVNSCIYNLTTLLGFLTKRITASYLNAVADLITKEIKS